MNLSWLRCLVKHNGIFFFFFFGGGGAIYPQPLFSFYFLNFQVFIMAPVYTHETLTLPLDFITDPTSISYDNEIIKLYHSLLSVSMDPTHES